MELRKRVILVFLAICLFLIVLKLSVDFPTGLGIYYGNTSATNPEGVIRFKVAPMLIVTLLSPPDNTIFTIPGAVLNVSLTCRVANLSPLNITQVKLYTDISGVFVVTQVFNITGGSSPYTVTFNVSNVPLGTYRWNCEGITSTGITAFAPADWHFTIKKTPTPPPGGGGGGGWIPPPVLELAGYPLPCVNPPDGLVSWFTFDKSTDDYWNASIKGIPFGSPAFIRGKDNFSISLDGTKDYVLIDPDNVYNGLAQGAIDAWIQYKGKDDYSVIFSYADPARSPALSKHMQLRINPAGFLEFEFRDGSDYRIVQPSAVINFKREFRNWVHIVLAYEDALYTWYINGVPYKSESISEGSPGYWFSDLAEGSDTLVGMIGAGLGSPEPSGFFKGAIDELEIYSRPLNLIEANAIYSRLKCRVEPPAPVVKEQPEMPEEAAEEIVSGRPRILQPGLISPIPLWLLLLALLGVAAVLLAYYKGVMKKKAGLQKKPSVMKKKKK